MDEAELRNRLRELADTDSPDIADVRAALSAGAAAEPQRHRRLPILVAAAVVLVTSGTIALLGDRAPAPQQPGFQPRDPSSVVTTDVLPSRSPTTDPVTSPSRNSSTPATSRESPSPSPSPTPSRSSNPSPTSAGTGTPDPPATTPPATEMEPPPSIGASTVLTTAQAPPLGITS